MSAETEAKVEEMAEKLWDAWQSVEAPSIPVRWITLVGYSITSDNFARNVAAFRAMARAALERNANGDEVRG